MLASELFLMNKKTRKNLDATDLYPLKKIFMTRRTAVVDTTTLEEFASDKKIKTKFLQELLSMPLPTTQTDKLNLPEKTTGKRPNLPYVKLNGEYKRGTKKTHPKIIIKGTGGSNKFTAELDLETGEETIVANGEQTLLMDERLYTINGTSLYERYVTNEIVRAHGGGSDNVALPSGVFERACSRFFSFVRTRNYDPADKANRFNVWFRIYLIPGRNRKARIEYVKEHPQASEQFMDMTGNMVSEYASEPTRYAKFLSFDDRAFTPNGTVGQKFYENIGIGYETFDKITLPADKLFRRGQFHWLFMDMTKPNSSFKDEIYRGIFYQLYKNYKKLERSSSGIHQREAMMKVLCIKMDTFKSKMEILIDENLTMDKLRKIFLNIEPNDIKGSELEDVLIINSNHYFRFVRAMLLGHGFERDLLVNLITKNIRENIFQWIKPASPPKEMKEFFRKADLCRKILSDRTPTGITMNISEEFAYKIGRIAGYYVWFRDNVGDKNHSFKDILTYSKYDRTKLRFVFQRVSQGIRFVKTDDAKLKKFDKFLTDNTPDQNNEISDNDKSNDYSYFFYSGLATTIGGVQ